jgi:hypothetical protein
MAKLNRHKGREHRDREMLSSEEINQIIDKEFNPVKIENQEPQLEQPEMTEAVLSEAKIKTTAAFDNSRLEFLRMQIRPAESFFGTLGNILFSFGMRLDIAEAKIENLKSSLDQLNLERALYKRYLEYCKENDLIGSGEGFVDFIREYAKEEESETKTNANKTNTN